MRFSFARLLLSIKFPFWTVCEKGSIAVDGKESHMGSGGQDTGKGAADSFERSSSTVDAMVERQPFQRQREQGRFEAKTEEAGPVRSVVSKTVRSFATRARAADMTSSEGGREGERGGGM